MNVVLDTISIFFDRRSMVSVSRREEEEVNVVEEIVEPASTSSTKPRL